VVRLCDVAERAAAGAALAPSDLATVLLVLHEQHISDSQIEVRGASRAGQLPRRR
jgi:hypothetical protein